MIKFRIGWIIFKFEEKNSNLMYSFKSGEKNIEFDEHVLNYWINFYISEQNKVQEFENKIRKKSEHVKKIKERKKGNIKEKEKQWEVTTEHDLVHMNAQRSSGVLAL